MTRLNSFHFRFVVWFVGLLLIVVGSTRFSPIVQGQDANKAAVSGAPDERTGANDESEEGDVLSSLGDQLFKSPGSVAEWMGVGFYLVLLVFSLFAATVIFERLFHLNRERVMPNSFCQRLNGALSAGQDSLENLRSISSSSGTPIASILRAGVLRAGRPLPEVEKSMEDAAAREMSALRSKHRALSVVGSVAPLIGLLGTVVGMIFAFGAASIAGLGSGQGLLQGLFVALWTTAGGLTIAIPCLLFAAWFNTQVDRFFREMDELLLETMPSFARLENGTTEVASAGTASAHQPAAARPSLPKPAEPEIETQDSSEPVLAVRAK